MKVSELEVGQVYTCVLSDQKVLVIETPKQTSKEVDGKMSVVSDAEEMVLAGKVCVEQNGMKMFSLIELHDGQLN